MKYHHQLRVPASVERVAEFHAHSISIAAITPPPIIVPVHHVPPVLVDGDEMDFTMWLGLPVLFAFRARKTKRILSCNTFANLVIPAFAGMTARATVN